MKKAKIIGKKTLSVFLAVLMVLTAWVWVAPTEAEAANGSYYVKISWTCDDAGDDYDTAYTGKASGTDNNVGLSLYFKTNNGRGTEQEKAWDLKSDMAKKGSYTATGTISGFPTSLYVYNNHGGATDKGIFRVTKIEVGSSSSNLKTIWSGEIYMNSTWNPKYVTLTSEGKQKDSNDTSNAKVTTSSINWIFPYVPSANSIYYDTNKNVSDIGIPPLGDSKDVDKSTHSIQYYAYDYYGVRYEPTSYTVTGVSGLTTGTGWSCGNAYPITATTSTTKSTVGVSQTATVTMNWNNGTSQTGQKANTTATFKVYNPRYKVAFNGNGGTLGTGYTWGYYYRPINDSTSTATSNNVTGLSAELFPTTGIKEGYSFKGMFTAASGGSQVYGSTTITDTKTYYAQWNINNYTATFYGKKANDAGTGTVEYVISTSTVPYNTKPTAPTTVDSYSLGDYDYVFNNTWDDEITNIGVNGAEYRAGYDPVFVEADYSAVNEIIAEAQDIINSENYEAIYSESSREKLETAVGLVAPDLGRTSQGIVDGYVTRIREAIDGLGRQKYSVIFIDQTDNSVIEMSYPVYYGDAITMPADPVKGFDSNYHYRFHSWQPSESGDDITFVSKNMIIYATFDKIAHTYTDTQLPSNCTTQAGVLHKCSCGYEYVEYSGSVGTEHSLETEWTIDIAPTCTSAGSKSYHCTRCSYRDSVTEIPALGHDLVYQGVVISPGCENDGAEVSECQRCGYDNYTIIPSGNHIWTEQVIAPTCTSSGYTIKTCSICGDEDIVSFVDPIAHTYVENTDEYIAPTCTGLGKKVSYCSCGAQKVETVDATNHQWDADPTVDFEATCTTKGQQSIHCSVCDIINQESITEIPENGHTWGNEVCEQKETCGVKGLYVKTCTVCGEDRARTVEALAHNYDTSTVAPTCTTKGYTIETCSKCGDVKYTNETPALNHAWTSTTHAADCTHSAYIEHVCGNDASHNYVEYVSGSAALTHDFTGKETIISDATCTSDGQKTVQCTRCDAVNEVIIPRLGHSYGAWVVVKEATNNEDGQWKRVCANNAEHVEYITIPKGGHNLVEISRTNAKCNEKGSVIYGCTAHTNCPITVTVELDYAQHKIAQREKEATCTKTGTVEAYCSECNIVLSTETIPVKAHSFVAQDAVAPTCTTAGYTPYECSACGFTYNVVNGAQALGHNYKVTTIAATCTATGLKTFTCDCGDSYTETIPATGHTYDAGTVVQNQSCTDVEKTEYKCACGDKYTVITKEAKGHTYTNWTVITPATADKSGVQMGTCACNDVKYDVLAPIGAHSFTETITKNPSCTEKGEKTFVCNEHENCSANYKAEIPATGHTQKIEYTAPTCITAGSTKVVCSVESCKAEILSTSIPATSKHDFSGEGKVTTAPTCTVTGIMTYTCTTVGCTATKTETIPAKGHVLSTTVNDAKCGEKGSVVTECANCNDPSVEKTVELSAKGHIWGATPIETEAADCENNGRETYKCQYCDKTNVVVIPALGHDWNDWTVVPSTNGTPGSVSRTCSVCNKVEKVDIPAGGHILTETARTNSTCVTPGSVTYTCQVAHVNGACGISVTVELPLAEHTIVTTEKPATCTEPGFIKKYCTVEGCTHVVVDEVRNKLAHVYTAGTAVAPTCTTSGYTPYKCDNCTSSYNKYDETKPATGHTLIEGTSTATCTTAGEMTLNCENCTYTTTVAVPALGHSYVEDTSAATSATCTALATKTYKCACGASYVKHEGTLADHQFNTLVKTVPATNESLGYEERQCVCGLTEITIIEATGTHVFNEKIEDECVAPTCTENGTDVYKCTAHTDCGVKSSVLVPRLGHSVTAVYKAPTCSEKGSSEAYCVECKDTLSSIEIPAKGHAYNTVEVTTEPGCESTGTRTYSCSCGASYTEEIPAKGHAFKTEVNDATCESTGTVVTTCENCTSYKETITLAAKNHNWNAGVENPKATCTSEGTMTYTCEACGETKTETIAKLSHDWGEWKVTPSTNDNPGSVSRKCKNCDATETVEIPAGGHNLVVGSKKDATCTSEGTITYVCDNHKGEANCGITVTVTIPMIQHVLEINTEKEAACEEDGLVVTKCTECNTTLVEKIIPAKGHTITVTTTLATCTTDGSVVEYCDGCKKTLNTTTIAKLGHDFNGDSLNVVNATCEVDGSKDVKCTRCDITTHVIIPHTGHDYGEWVKTEATNDKDGSWYHKCANCGKEETLIIPAGGHNLVEDTSKYVAPTCIEKGKQVYKCTAHENCSVTVTVELDYAQHTVAQKINKATCTTKGSVVAYCSVEGCGEEFSTKEIPVKAHVYTEGTAVAPSCTTSGYTPYTCSCGDTYNKYDASKPATGHTLVEGASTADCTTAGKMTLTCENCTYTTTVDVPALGHNYVENAAKATEATCAAAATKTYECSRCDVSYTISVGDKTSEHTWGAWEVKESATASSLGYQTRTCDVCGKMEVETIAATGTHNFTILVPEESKDPTCTEVGYETKRCSAHENCTEKSTIELPATGHTEKHEYQAATCEGTGYSRMVCAVCDEVLSTETIPALGHDWNGGNITNATCKTEGEIVRTCSRGCTDTHITKIPVNLNAHQYETKVVPATCYNAGSVVTKCSLCGDITTNETLAQLNHSWNDGEVTTAATCTTEGVKTYTCTICSTKKTEPIAKSGHNWNDWVKTDATNSKDGEWKRVCKTNENHVETLVIPKGGHTFGDTPDSTTPATCTATGTATYNCTAHTGENACGVTITVTLDKLQHEMVTETITEVGCETEGKTVTKCKTCDTQTTETTIPATGHAWGKGVETKAASCTEEGTMTFTCANDATHQYSTKIAKLQHNYVAGTPVAPTCTSNGYTPYKCETCESSYVILGEAAKCHTYVKDSSTADCENGGVMTLKCACGATMTTDVPKLGHDYQLNSTTTATCAAAATETYKCTRCDANYTVSVGSKTENHDWNDWVTVEKADYDSIGYKTRTCKICDKLEVETIPATGSHKLVEDHRDNATCTADGKIYYTCDTHDDCGVTDEVVIPKLGHIEELRYSAPSCTAEGSTSIYCTRCNNTIGEEKVLAKLEHTYEVVDIENSTCSVKGEISLKCKYCTETNTVEIPVNADAHKLVKNTELATCTKAGSVTVTCENGCDYNDVTPLPMLQHSWGDWSVKTPSTNDAEGEMIRYCGSGCTETVKIPEGGHAFGKEPDSKTPASCTAEGSATYKCTAHTNCGVEITVKLDKAQHTVVTDSETATCENGGYVKVYCSKCNEVYTDMTIGKLAHKDKIVETKEATCTTAGYTTFECENCGRGFSRLDAQPTGHKYLNEGAVVTTPATCTEAGYTTYNCDNCDETHTVSIVAAKGHSWTEWTVEKAATNNEKGLLSRTCINGCGEKETAEIPAGGHSFNTDEPSATTDGTCLVKGTKTFKCSAHSDCGVTITVETEFGAHAWSDWTKVDATNDTDGSWTRECAVCHTKEAHVIPKGDHKFGDTPSSTVPATCKKTGTATYNCTTHTNCGVTITVVLEMIQHTAGVDKKDATCTENGYVKTYCTACGDVISNVELEKTGHVETTTTRQESTCVAPGWEKVICKCGELVSEKELPLIAHNYDKNGDGKVDKNDAVFEDGKYTYTCSLCGETETEDADDLFEVRFFDAEGKLIEDATQNVKFGERAVAPAAPEKKADGTYHYEFSAWDRNYSKITSDLDVYPTYEKEAHYGGEATCTTLAKCEKCNAYYGEYDESKHTVATKSKAASCETDGWIEYYCTNAGCKYNYNTGVALKKETIGASGHVYGQWTVIQNGTCEIPQIQQRKCVNYGCDKIEERRTQSTHTWLIEPRVEPTCTTVGYSEFRYCVTCNLQIDRVEIPKTDHRDLDGNGYCDYCGTSKGAPKCNCMCHSTGIMKFFYTIVRFFWIITRSSPSCSCGAVHY